MTKNVAQFIDFGTGVGQVSSRDLPGNFTPTNYTPSQVDSEGNDKVSAHLKGIDSALGSVSTPTVNDNDFDVGAGGATDFVASSGTIGVSNRVDVYLNGRLLREGASHDYTRNTSLNKIVTNETIVENAWIRIRIFS